MTKKQVNPATEINIPDEAPDYTPPPDEGLYRVSFALPLGVLVAVLDATHELADTEGAVRLGLLGSGGSLSTIGKLVAGGFDRTAVGHKMAAAWRIRHNGETDRKNGLKS